MYEANFEPLKCSSAVTNTAGREWDQGEPFRLSQEGGGEYYILQVEILQPMEKLLGNLSQHFYI